MTPSLLQMSGNFCGMVPVKRPWHLSTSPRLLDTPTHKRISLQFLDGTGNYRKQQQSRNLTSFPPLHHISLRTAAKKKRRAALVTSAHTYGRSLSFGVGFFFSVFSVVTVKKKHLSEQSIISKKFGELYTETGQDI